MAEARRTFVFCLILVSTETLRLPDYIKPCSRNDPKFNDCALKHGRDAIPRIVRGDRKLGVPVLDPLLVDKLSMTHSGIHATSKNFTIVGVKDAVLEFFSVDFDKHVIKLTFSSPRVVLSGDYDVGGNIMGLPFNGQGDYELLFNGLRGNYTTNYTLTQLEDGELYAIPDTYDVEFDAQGMKVNFRNLFNGNKLMGDAMNNFINDNWRIVLEDIGKPIFVALGSIVHQILMNVSQKVPYNELFTN